MNGWRLSLRLCSILACLAVGSCGPDSTHDEVGRAGPPARHAVHSQALRSIMSGFDQEMHHTWPQEIAELKRQQNHTSARFDEIVETATRLANAAHAIPESVPDSELAGPDRQAFMHLVAQLESQSRGLAQQASLRSTAGVDTALDQVRATCTGCHSQFREYTGPLPSGS